MTEEQIERHVERQMNALDATLMGGKFTQEQYDAEVKKLNAWADREFDLRRRI